VSTREVVTVDFLFSNFSNFFTQSLMGIVLPCHSSMKEVVVVCLPDRNDDARDQAMFIKVVAYIGDGTIYV
jgi:hypothetical protein